MSSRHARRIGYLRLPVIGTGDITLHADHVVGLMASGPHTRIRLRDGRALTVRLYAQHLEYMLWLATRQRLVQWNPRRDIPASKAWHRLADGSTEHVAEWSDRLIPLDALQEAAAERFDAVAELLRAHDIQIVEPRLMPGWKQEHAALAEEQHRWVKRAEEGGDISSRGMGVRAPDWQPTTVPDDLECPRAYQPFDVEYTSLGTVHVAPRQAD